MPDDSVPLVSIVVPSWQQGRFLRGCLKSLLHQTHSRVEIIVQDNCSTDETAEVLREYAPRLTAVTREADSGQSEALNRGFARSQGAILGWLNADDLLMPEALAQTVAFFQREPAVDVVHGQCAQLDEAGQFLRYFHESQPVTPEILFNLGDFLPQPSTFFRRTIWERCGGLDPLLHYALDWDLWCKMAAAGARFQMAAQVWSGARVYGGAKTGRGGWKRLKEIHRVCRRYKTRRLPLATLGYTYGTYVRPRFGGLDRPLKRVWRGLSGQKGLLETRILGLAHQGLILEPRFAVRFPLYGPLGGGRLVLSRARGAPAWPEVQATLNGETGEVRANADGQTLEVQWVWAAPREAESVEVDVVLPGYAPGTAPLHLHSFSFLRPLQT